MPLQFLEYVIYATCASLSPLLNYETSLICATVSIGYFEINFRTSDLWSTEKFYWLRKTEENWSHFWNSCYTNLRQHWWFMAHFNLSSSWNKTYCGIY